jgi:peptidoglycan/LPS O-acetylase OafA/YrhL
LLAHLRASEARVPLKSAAATHANAFDALRVGAALWVLFSHAHALLGLPEPIVFAGHPNVAVDVFFTISGYLVMQSWERDPDIFRFFVKRSLRIFPGLLVCLVFTAVVVGLLATTLAPADYLRAPDTWKYIYSNTGLSLFSSMPFLPGVFEQNTFPRAVNGSLWTLRYEVVMYLMLGGIGLIGAIAALTKASKHICLLAFIGFAAWAVALFFQAQTADKIEVPLLWRAGLNASLAVLGLNFFAGCCLHLYRKQIVLNSALAAAGVILAAWLPHSLLQSILVWLFVPYATIVFAWNAPEFLKKFKNLDYSYGIYIYAFPLQQLMSMYGQRHGWSFTMILACSLILTIAAAALSWHWVEKPALKFKPRIQGGKLV